MTAQDYSRRILDLGNGILRLLAPNPSAMTLAGTNTYIIGGQSVAIIDPGPYKADHLESLLALVAGRPVSHILITHSHVDHSPLSRKLSKAVKAPVLAFGDSEAGRSEVMTKLAESGLAGGGEGVDTRFKPDQTLADGELVKGDGWEIEAIHTPGHFGNHMCFRLGDDLFTGDQVMGWASSLVSPPDGNLTDFMASCRKLLRVPAARFLPGHGGTVDNPQSRLNWLIAHRDSREDQILSALSKGPATVADLTGQIYFDLEEELWPAASRNVFAHLVDLHVRNKVKAWRKLSLDAKFSLA